MDRVRWGILSTANIGLSKVVPGMLKSPAVDVVGIASRDPARAREAAARLGLRRVWESYEALIEDPEIEAIYNPLPNHLHVPMTLAAARAGKHVLCEKPIALTAAEAEALRAVRPGVLVAEAFMVRHAPQWRAVRELVRGGRIGDPRAVQALFSYFNRDPGNVRNRREIGGGGLLDIGCYPVTVSRFVFEAEPVRVVACFDRDPDFGIDRTVGGLADFGAGRHLSFTVSTQAAPWQRVQLLGTAGRIEVEIPFNAPPDRPNRIFVQGMAMNEGEWIAFPAADQYMLQAEAFGRAIRGLAPLEWGVEDAIRNMRVLDAFFRSEAGSGWERP